MKNFINYIKGFFEEEGGKPSMKRLILASLTISFVISYVKSAVATFTVPDIPSGWLTLFLGALGIMAATSAYIKKNG